MVTAATVWRGLAARRTHTVKKFFPLAQHPLGGETLAHRRGRFGHALAQGRVAHHRIQFAAQRVDVAIGPHQHAVDPFAHDLARPGIAIERHRGQAAGHRFQQSIQAGGGNDKFVDVVRTVSKKVFPQAREFDMGKFKRTTIRGAFGNMVVGRIGNVMVGVRGARSSDPARMWEHLSVQLESVCGGAA